MCHMEEEEEEEGEKKRQSDRFQIAITCAKIKLRLDRPGWSPTRKINFISGETSIGASSPL